MHRSILAATLISAWLASCGGASPTPPTAPATTTTTTTTTAPTASSETTTSSNLVPPGEAKLGDKTRCPVSGDEFVVDADSPKTDYEGKTYFFCCAHCAKKFNAEPTKYAGPKP